MCAWDKPCLSEGACGRDERSNESRPTLGLRVPSKNPQNGSTLGSRSALPLPKLPTAIFCLAIWAALATLRQVRQFCRAILCPALLTAPTNLAAICAPSFITTTRSDKDQTCMILLHTSAFPQPATSSIRPNPLKTVLARTSSQVEVGCGVSYP